MGGVIFSIFIIGLFLVMINDESKDALNQTGLWILIVIALTYLFFQP